MINDNKPLSMPEVLDYAPEKDSEISKFIKSFTKIKPEQAKKMRNEIEGLGLMKVRSEHISKIIDLVPENQEDLNKIFVGVSLDEDESKSILEKIKEFK